jgi:hypothetical protein
MRCPVCSQFWPRPTRAQTEDARAAAGQKALVLQHTMRLRFSEYLIQIADHIGPVVAIGVSQDPFSFEHHGHWCQSRTSARVASTCLTRAEAH